MFLRARTELKHRKNLGERINGQPEKAAPVWSCEAWFAAVVQLQMREVQAAETALVQGLSVLASVR